MKHTKNFLAVLLSLILASIMLLSVSAEDALTSQEVLASNRWVALHRWDFNGNLVDSIGGATVTKVDKAYFQEPTYANGKIVLNGYSAYTLDEALEFPSTDELKYLRIDVKAKLEFGGTQGAHRIFGLNTGSKMAGLNYINIAGAQYGSCSFALSTDSKAWGSFVIIPDQAKFDKTAENLYTFIFYDSNLYYFANGVLIGSAPNAQGGAFTFTDFLGCSYVDTPVSNNAVGEIDYIEISMFGPEKANNNDSDSSGSNNGNDNANTGVSLIAIPVAILSATGVVVISSRKRTKVK